MSVSNHKDRPFPQTGLSAINFLRDDISAAGPRVLPIGPDSGGTENLLRASHTQIAHGDILA